MRRESGKKVTAIVIALTLVLSGKIQMLSTSNYNVYAEDLEHYKDLEDSVEKRRDFEIEQNAFFGWSGGSNKDGNNRFVSGEIEFANLTFTGFEDKSKFYYSDDYFKESSTLYNEHLSTMSIELAVSGVGNYIEDPKDKYGNAKDVLSKIGFENITPNADFLKKPEENTMGSVIANKHIYIKNTSGNVEEYNLMAIVPRSANYESEWVSNFKIGGTGDHQGFSESRDIIYNHFETFYNDHYDDYGNIPVKIWVVGYSRGAAVANMLGGKITDNATSFNSRKEDVYGYTLGTPKGALISNHTTPPLDSYTNIHNVVAPADLFSLVAPSTFGFGRYGVDHYVPYYRSDKVHDDTLRHQITLDNASYMVKYNSMLEYLRKFDPTAEVDINDLKMYELTLIDLTTFQFMIFKQLGQEEFRATSNEAEYYQSYEFFPTVVNNVLAKDVFEASYSGIDYGNIKGRTRYYEKYQDLLMWLVKTFLGGGGNTEQIMAKIQENANNNMMAMLALVPCLMDLVYCEEPQARNHFIPFYDPAHADSYTESSYVSAYDMMYPVYQALFNGAFSESDYNFLMSKHRDITDFLLDLLNADYRTSYLPSKSAIGTIYQNAAILKALHMDSYYISWLQSEDSFFETPPADTFNYEGMKMVTFTDLTNSVVEVYDENDNKICEYTVDENLNATYSEIIENKYTDLVKAYNPEGMELRVPSDVNYRAVVKANNKSIGNVTYKEYFVVDAEFYRKEKSLGNIHLNSDECYEIKFSESSVAKVKSCYKKEELSGYKASTFKLADMNGQEVLYGEDSFSYANEITFEKKSLTNTSLMTTSEFKASYSSIDLNYSVATVSSATVSDVLEISEIDMSENGLDDEDTVSTASDVEDEGNNEDSDNLTDDENRVVATDSKTNEEIVVTGFSGTEHIDNVEENIEKANFGAPVKYRVDFNTNALGTFYYYNGETYVEGRSGDEYEAGTEIKITAPLTYDGRPFYGWTLMDSNDKRLNAKGVDTPKIVDESDTNNSTYVIELRNYDIKIVANYEYKEYKLTLSVASDKGRISPEDSAMEFLSVDDFNAAKSNITINGRGNYTFSCWNDGSVNYRRLLDYNWDYKKDVVLNAIFTYYDPAPSRGGNGGTGGGGGGGASITTYGMGDGQLVTNTVVGNNIHNEVPIGNWKSGDTIIIENGAYKYEIAPNVYLTDGIYRISSNYYMFDKNGHMLTGLHNLNDRIYYFEEKGSNVGAMIQGERNIKGVLYTFGQDGALILPQNGAFVAANGEWVYHPITNDWEYYAYGSDGSKNKLTSGVFSIKNADNTYSNYFFDYKGMLLK
ncbi:MAG: hypothetical protein J6O09_02995 [Lachnospiraceae bacterium]|nr:hypothetical protein [Lachnospiraceae bacterium]